MLLMIFIYNFGKIHPKKLVLLESFCCHINDNNSVIAILTNTFGVDIILMFWVGTVQSLSLMVLVENKCME